MTKSKLLSHETNSEEGNAYDCFTELAVHVLNVEVSLVTVIDQLNSRQIFKAQIGLEEPWASRNETPLTHSFCQHVVNDDVILCVEDATTHDLVKENLAILDLGVMAYLGAPIRDRNGKAFGAFCVISGKPRKWSTNEKETISRISKCVSEFIITKEKSDGVLPEFC